MDSDFVKIAKIGVKIVSENTSKSVKVLNDEFFFGNYSFRLVIEVDILKVVKGMSNIISRIFYENTFFYYFLSRCECHAGF